MYVLCCVLSCFSHVKIKIKFYWFNVISIKISVEIFIEIEKNPKFQDLRNLRDLDSQAVLKKEEPGWKPQTFWFQNILPNNNNQNNVILA